ncbi:K02A2.6-like [Cordylochernes scorpioides]|uniref:K02A2.6-like n=1 Tax=Cordylochernes scorpioides TaxID=51811 RepID=A0ABY6LER5_9ARAC|nr:K02A2.6-like [Cordylochernes scorpioides]
MASSTGNSLQPFVPGTNPSEAWGKWKKRFQMFYIATEIDKKSIPRQRAILLYNIGELALDIYSTFKIQETDASPTVPDILELFDGHFKPYKNTTYKRYQFFTTEQGENQNFDDYVTELKNKSMDCEFGELADSLVRDRIIIGIKDKALKERMLQDPDLSLAKAIDLGRATETSRQQVKNITREDVDLHSIKYKKQYKKNFKYPVGRKPNVSEEHPKAKVCQNCGSRHPYGKCFAYGKICNSCKKPNHFAKMCRNRVHMLEERAEEEEEMCLQYLSLDSITGLEWTKIILVENNSVNILPLDTIKNWQNKPCIYPTGIAVYSYTGEKVPIRGKCKASCTSGKKSEILEFLVVDLPAPPILGLAACKKLELILKVESLEQDHTRTKMDASPTKIIESYRDVFDEIGTLPGEHSVILRENAQPSQRKEPLIPHEIADYPWQKVAIDFFYLDQSVFIIIVDYYSSFPEVIKVASTSAKEILPVLKSTFARHGIPEIIITDNGPPFTSQDFTNFTNEWDIEHKTSSPGYPKSNGLVERMVQTVKKQLKKCRQDNTDPYMCLIALRTTPSNNLPSPAQMLMGRNLRTLIPMKTTKLKPAFISTENILQQKRENQYKMKEYYDRNAKLLPKMSSGEQVNAKTSNAWRPATIIGEANQPRSYIIQNNEGRMLKRNRVHLRPRSYPVGQRRSSQSSPQLDPAPSTSSESSGQREPGEFPRLNLSPEELAPSTSTPIGNYNEGGTAYTTRSGRVVKPPKRFDPGL